MKRKLILILSGGFLIFALSGCNQVEEVLDKVIDLLDEELADNASTNTKNENEDTSSKQTNQNEHNSTTDESEEAANNNDSAGSSESENNMNNDDMPGEHEDSMLSLRGELRESGESEVDNLSLPNGLPLSLPEDWVLIEEVQSEPWEGVLCFEKNHLEWHTEDDDYEDGVDSPHTFHTNIYETIKEIEDDFKSYGYDVTSKNIMDNSFNVHQTIYEFEDEGVSWKGNMEYFFHHVGDNSFSCARVLMEQE